MTQFADFNCFIMFTLEGLDFKTKKALLLKKAATSAHSWNTLFLGQNAVTDIIADTYNTTKEKVNNVHLSKD